MKHVDIYTDGACSGNPGAGGYCAILIFNGIEKVVSGGEDDTTNNRMELLAVIKGLKALKEPCMVDLYSDSQYVINAINEKWLENWSNSDWRNASKKSVKNIGATGGVFYNEAITNTVKNHIESNGFNFIQHKNTCAGDGSVSLGQAIIAKKV